jgi:DNA repair exonuclease SbcCD ATPase subunit
MAIVSLISENVKRLKVVSIQPNGKSLVIVGGDNGSGKSSTIDSVAMALQGGKAIPSKPVRDGEKTASVILELDDLIVHRKFTAEGKTSLVVTNKEGAKYSSPQAMLDKMVGALSFDPLAFSRMKAKEQEESLRELLGIDTSALDAAREEAYAERTLINRDVKQLEAQIEAMPMHGALPDEELAVDEVQDALAAARSHNATVDAMIREADEASAQADRLSERLNDCDAEIARLMAELKSVQERKVATKKAYTETTSHALNLRIRANDAKRIDEDEIFDKLMGLGEINRKIAENKDLQRRQAELDAKVKESQAFSAKIEQIDQAKQSMLRSAAYPIAGLAISDAGGLEMNGIPLDQCSSAEQLRVSFTICVAMNPKLPVVLIREGSLCDAKSLKLIEDMATQYGCQVWMERVSTGDECSVIISEGEVLTDRVSKRPALAAAK